MAPDNNSAIDEGRSNISERLANLDSDFNTNKDFGFMGIMKSNEEKLRQESVVEEVKEEKTEPKLEVPDWVAPVNTSVQAIRNEFQQGIGHLTNELNQLRQSRQTESTTESEFPPEVAPIVHKLENVDRTIGTLALRQEQARARDALRDARTKYKDFNYTDEELNQVWNDHVRGNPNTAATTNWDMYFRQQHESRSNPKLTSENEKLKAEIERLKSSRNSVKDLLSVPRSNRQSSTLSSKSSDDSDFDEELYQRAKRKIQKGKFMGFNRALLEEQRKMSLAG